MTPTLDVLLPAGLAPLAPREDEADLVALLDTVGDRVVRANMVATLDGAATGADRVSGSINGAADHRVFQAARALADVVLVGAGTVRQEGYGVLALPAALVGTRRAHGRSGPVELALVTRSGDVPERLLAADRPPYVVTGAACPRLADLRRRLGDDHVVVTDDERGDVDLADAVDRLAALGMRSVLTEGGPSLLASAIGSGVVDELLLTWSPLVVGGPAPRVLDDAPWFVPPRRAELVHLLHGDGMLLGRWRIGRVS